MLYLHNNAFLMFVVFSVECSVHPFLSLPLSILMSAVLFILFPCFAISWQTFVGGITSQSWWSSWTRYDYYFDAPLLTVFIGCCWEVCVHVCVRPCVCVCGCVKTSYTNLDSEKALMIVRSKLCLVQSNDALSIPEN